MTTASLERPDSLRPYELSLPRDSTAPLCGRGLGGKPVSPALSTQGGGNLGMGVVVVVGAVRLVLGAGVAGLELDGGVADAEAIAEAGLPLSHHNIPPGHPAGG